MELVKEEVSIHVTPSEMPTLNDEICTVIKCEDQEATAPTADEVGFFRSHLYESGSVWKKSINGTVF
jgi:hypothetical protein